jgi:hypothetical protein
MQNLLKICAGILVVAVFNLQVPAIVLAAQGSAGDRSDGITKNAPEMVGTPEVSIPGTKTWLWWMLGALVVGGAVAAAGGGGGGGDGGTSSSGGISVSW